MRSFARGRSLRVRITAAFVATGILLASTISTATFLAVRGILEDQRVRSATRQTVFGLLFAREFVRTDPEDLEQLVSLLQTREEFQAMVTTGGDWFSTSLGITPEVVPDGLRGLVAEERLGYQRTSLERRRVLAFGAPLPPAGTDLYLFFPMDDIDETLSVLLRALGVTGFGVVVAAIIVAQRVGGRILRPLGEVSAAAQRVAEGLLETRVEAASSDEVGRLAASFNEMASAFQEMLQRERRFVANVSHELRTPLSTLRTASELLQTRRDELAPAAREAVDLLADDVGNLRRLIEELMEVSEVDSGKAVVRWEPVNLRALAEAVVAKARRDATVSGPSVVTVSDKARLERVVGNLLDNAYEHGEGRDVRVAIEHDDVRASITVSDRGPGIPGEAMPHLFDRFYKSDRSRTRERGGVGLGLAIAIENARLLGGTIEASSDGGGATFRLRLPLREEGP